MRWHQELIQGHIGDSSTHPGARALEQRQERLPRGHRGSKSRTSSTSAAERYNSHVPYVGALQPEGSPKFSYQTHVTVISIGRARSARSSSSGNPLHRTYLTRRYETEHTHFHNLNLAGAQADLVREIPVVNSAIAILSSYKANSPPNLRQALRPRRLCSNSTRARGAATSSRMCSSGYNPPASSPCPSHGA